MLTLAVILSTEAVSPDHLERLIGKVNFSRLSEFTRTRRCRETEDRRPRKKKTVPDARARLLLARVSLKLNQWIEALDHATTSADDFRDLGLPVDEALAAIDAALAAYFLGKLDRSEVELRRAIHVLQGCEPKLLAPALEKFKAALTPAGRRRFASLLDQGRSKVLEFPALRKDRRAGRTTAA